MVKKKVIIKRKNYCHKCFGYFSNCLPHYSLRHTRVVKLLLCAYYYYYYFIYLNSLLLLLLLLRHIFKQPITITITITRKFQTAYYYYYYYYLPDFYYYYYVFNYYNYFPDYYYYFPILLHYPWTKQTQHKQIIKTFITSLCHLIVVCRCVSWQLKVI